METAHTSTFSFLLFMAFSLYSAKAQPSRFHIAGGFSAIWLTGSTPATEPLFPKDTSSVFGGGIEGHQPGISLRAIYMADTNRLLRLTLGGDYFFVSGEQTIDNRFFQITARSTLHIATLTAGFEYAFATLPLANGRVYAGVEGRCSFIENIGFMGKVYYKDFDSTEISTYRTKETATRFGTALRLGVEGEILDPMFINISVAYNALNMFNRDDNRGELLTPQVTNEKKESVVGNFLFSFWLQYRL